MIKDREQRSNKLTSAIEVYQTIILHQTYRSPNITDVSPVDFNPKQKNNRFDKENYKVFTENLRIENRQKSHFEVRCENRDIQHNQLFSKGALKCARLNISFREIKFSLLTTLRHLPASLQSRDPSSHLGRLWKQIFSQFCPTVSKQSDHIVNFGCRNTEKYTPRPQPENFRLKVEERARIPHTPLFAFGTSIGDKRFVNFSTILDKKRENVFPTEE